jgi:predicted nucleic acid-binding protein
LTVIDASVLTAYVLGAPAALDAVVDRDSPLHAPELIELETLNALRRLVRHGKASLRDGEEAVAALGAVPLVRHPHALFRDRIWALRDELTAYDAAYLAVAEMLPGGVLVTGDRGLAVRAARSLGPEGVHFVE